jgi:hypothetical protein
MWPGRETELPPCDPIQGIAEFLKSISAVHTGRPREKREAMEL